VSADGQFLYVTNGGANSVAVIHLAHGGDEESAGGSGGRSELTGLIPTGWYPNSVSVSADGAKLYGRQRQEQHRPVPQNCTDVAGATKGDFSACGAANQYVWQLTKAGFLTLPVPRGEGLGKLTAQVAQNNNYSAQQNVADADMMGFLHGKIQHVIYIVKENRTYDQILGDLRKGNGDPSIVVYPQPLTPNLHALANNFRRFGQLLRQRRSERRWLELVDLARAADTIEKTEPINYAGRGLNYDYEGTNRNVNVALRTFRSRTQERFQQIPTPAFPSEHLSRKRPPCQQEIFCTLGGKLLYAGTLRRVLECGKAHVHVAVRALIIVVQAAARVI